MDALPPDPVAATALYPRSAREKELCEEASRPDWVYLAIPPVLVAGAIILDTQVFKYDPNVAVREMGPSFVGLTWGLFAGSFWPSLPRCSPHFASTVPPEGQVRTDLPLALAIALFAGMTAPFIDWIAIGPLPAQNNSETWTDSERITRIALAGTLAFGAALLPYVLPPLPLRAFRQLLEIRPTVSAQGAYVSCGVRF